MHSRNFTRWKSTLITTLEDSFEQQGPNILFCTCNKTQIDKKRRPTENVYTIIADPAAVKWECMPHVTGYTIVVCLNLKHRRLGAGTAEKESGNKAGRLHHSSGAHTLREELKAWKANLSIPQIELGEPKQTIASWTSARKLSGLSACNKTLLDSLSEWLAAANQQWHTGTIKAVVTNRQTGCKCSVANLKKKKL